VGRQERGKDNVDVDSNGNPHWLDSDKQIVDTIQRVAETGGVSMAQVAIAWVLKNPGVDAPIVGATRQHHLTDAVAALDLQLTDDEVTRSRSPTYCGRGPGSDRGPAGGLPGRSAAIPISHQCRKQDRRMSSWNKDDLRAIAESHDLYISPFREDGTTYGTPTLVWPLVVDGDVYVRAANGQQSSWYVAALSQKAGRIRVVGKDHDVIFEPAGGEVASAIDAAYEQKYRGQLRCPDHAGGRAEVGHRTDLTTLTIINNA
jgi:hypothetical protein